MLVTFGGFHPRTGEYYSNLVIEGQGWGGRHGSDGWDVTTNQSANCVVTPVEVFETRYPLRHERYEINTDSGGAGEFRGGLGGVRVMELEAPMTISCYHSGERLAPWGLFGGEPGTVSSLEVQLPGDEDYASFKTRFGVRCASKFTNVQLPAGAKLRLTVGGGGGYGSPSAREVDAIAQDLFGQLLTVSAARDRYPQQIEAALAERDRRVAALREGGRRSA
jgi:N-methylhydantoinase B/oxoprolinase/acetone carboxylase alpha subunit